MSDKAENKELAKEVEVSLGAYLRTLSSLKWSRIRESLWLVLLVFSIIGYFVLLPLKTVETRYVEFSSSGNNFVKVAVAGEAVTGNDNLSLMMLRKYVTDRERVNHIDEENRYDYVYAMSTSEVADDFKLFYGGEDALIHKDHITREIILGPVTRLSKDILIIDFETVDTNAKKKKREGEDYKPNRRQWQTTMRYAYAPQEVKDDAKLLNPIGIFVTKYQAHPRRY